VRDVRAEDQDPASASRVRDMSGATAGPVVRRVEVRNRAGLHTRPAAILSAEAKKYAAAEIELVLVAAPDDHHLEAGARADAKSIVELISLGAPCGTRFDIEAHGAQATAAADALAHLFDTRFGLESEDG
jgi:phosphotransferase system HPr (HPr) family protein